jgi:hypothetical protein
MRNQIRIQIFKVLVFLAMFTLCAAAFAQEPKEMKLIEAPGELKEKVVVMNHNSFPLILKEFKDGCKFYQVNHDKLFSLDAIKLVPGNLGFLGRVEGNVIEVNQELVNYPNLLRLVTLRQLGKYLGLKELKEGREIMSETWSLTLQDEIYARRHRDRPHQRKHFFEALAENKPLKKEI